MSACSGVEPEDGPTAGGAQTVSEEEKRCNALPPDLCEGESGCDWVWLNAEQTLGICTSECWKYDCTEA